MLKLFRFTCNLNLTVFDLQDPFPTVDGTKSLHNTKQIHIYLCLFGYAVTLLCSPKDKIFICLSKYEKQLKTCLQPGTKIFSAILLTDAYNIHFCSESSNHTVHWWKSWNTEITSCISRLRFLPLPLHTQMRGLSHTGAGSPGK